METLRDYINVEHEPVTVEDQQRWLSTAERAIEPLLQAGDTHAALTDLLTNLRHWAQRTGLDYEAADRMAQTNWEAEQPRKGPPSQVPNLDALDDDELEQFALRHKGGRQPRELFPEGGAGTTVATTALARYAGLTHQARLYRREGRIADALVFEDKADWTYQGLPEWAQW